MRLILLPISALFLSAISYSQSEAVNFSDAIKPHLNKYNLQSDFEFERGNIEKGQFLFDSLVSNYLVGSRINDYALKNVNGGKTRLGKIKKPVVLITYASWCVINKGEIKALNKLAKKYSKDVKIIALFWDEKQNVSRTANNFSRKIKVCYANEAYKNDSNIVSTLKHTLGFPTSYFLDANLNIIDIKRGGISTANSDQEQAFSLNYKLFDQRLAYFLMKKDSKTQLADVQ